jgi:transcriptional regulator with XRE-family HTH domain
MKYYKKLRAKLLLDGITQEQLAKRLGLATCTVSLYFTGRIKWRIDQIYKVCDCLGIPYAEISEYFPKGGV